VKHQNASIAAARKLRVPRGHMPGSSRHGARCPPAGLCVLRTMYQNIKEWQPKAADFARACAMAQCGTSGQPM